MFPDRWFQFALLPFAFFFIGYTFHQGNDNVYPCANGLNDGQYAYNNLQMFDNTWYHKFSATWHMATEAWFMYQRGVPNVSSPLAPIRTHTERSAPPARSAAWRRSGRRSTTPKSSSPPTITFRFASDFLDDMKGQRTGFKGRCAEEALMWGPWVGSTILLRPEIRFDHAFDRPAYDDGTRKSQFTLAMDVIFKY